MSGDQWLRANEHPNRRIFLVWLLLCVIFLAVGAQRLLQGQFPDPDDALRLVQVRDLIAGQNWFDLHQYRINPPDGTLMHWSRLVDLPIAAIIVLLSPIIGSANAETAALIAIPLIILGLILLAIGRLAWRLFDLDVAGYACLSVGLLAPLVFQLQPMRIDHHGWQILSVAAALGAISLRSAVRGGALAGLAMAFGLSISIEVLPMVAAFGAVLALRWFRDHHQRWWLVAFMQSFALGLAGLFLATRGFSDLAEHCDAVSPAHLGFFAITAIGTSAIAALPKASRVLLAVMFAVVGIAGLSLFVWAAPDCAGSPFGSLDPLVRDFWYINVSEGRPLWEQEMGVAMPIMLQLLLALAATVILIRQTRDSLRDWWTDYALVLSASILLSLLVWRSAAFAAVISAIPLGWLAARLLKRVRGSQKIVPRLIAALAVMIIFLPAMPFKIWAMVAPEAEMTPASMVRESSCQIRDQAASLNRLPKGTIFAPLDIGPAILLKSHHSVVATGHHRAEMAMRDVIAAFTSSENEAQAIMRAHGADYVAMCTDLIEANLLSQSNPHGLAAQLIAGELPEWLEAIATDGPSEFRVWRITN